MKKKKVSSCIRKNWIFAVLSPLSIAGEVWMSVLIPYKMADLVDYGIEKGNIEVVKSIGLTLVIYAFLSMLFGILSGVFSSLAGSGYARNIRHDMYENIQTFSFSNIDKYSTAGLVTRMTTDVTRVQNSFVMALRMACRAPIMLVMSLIAAFKVNRDISMVFLAAIPFLLIGLFAIVKVAMPLFERMFKEFDNLNMNIQENVRGIRAVKSFVREDYENKKFLKTAAIVRDLSIKAEKAVAYNRPIMSTAIYGCMIAISWIGAKLCVKGSLTTGQLMSIFSYVMQILSSLMLLSIAFVMLTMARASKKRIGEILNEKSDIVNCENPEMEVKNGSVEFKNVSFLYAKGGKCVSDVSFKIESGETIGIIGGTGSGKTSIVQLIPRLYDAVEGEVLVGGTNVKNIDLDTLRKNVSMVLQKNVLFEGTIRENLMWGKEDATIEDIHRALKIACADGFVSEIPGGLDAMLEQGGSNLSGGQKQRLCIARALISMPKILIMDDSTSAVDTATEKSIRQAFREYMPRTTKIIIAQRISSVQDADRIIVLDNGAISGIGTHDELLANNEIYREVFESQTKGGDFDEPSAE